MNRSAAALLVLGGATCMSFVGLLVRLMEQADGFQILFYRSYALAAAVAVVACIRRRVGFLAFMQTLDWVDFLIGFLLALAFTTYILAMLNTTIASALFILSATPMFAALLAWLFIHERPSITTVMALILAVVGVGLMVADGLSGGGIVGKVYALASALCFAATLVTMRWTRREDSLGGTFIGGLFSVLINAVLCVTLGAGFAISGWDFGLSLFMGAFTIGIGIALVTWGAGYMPAAEVSVLVLIESVLGPMWVWIFLGELASHWVLTGGAIVIAAVTLQAWGTRREGRRAQVALG